MNATRSHQVSILSVSFALLGLLALSSTVSGQELTADQTAKYNSVVSALKGATANVDLVTSAFANGTPKGSRAKLAKVRLAQASQSLPKIKEWIGELPAGNENVKELAKSYDSLEKAITSLNDQLNGSTSVKPPASNVDESATNTKNPPKEMAKTKTTGTKLDYRQVEVLKGVRFNLREVEARTEAIHTAHEQMIKVGDPLEINFRTLDETLASIAAAERKVGFAKDGLAKLPPTGEGVAEQAEKLSEYVTKLSSAKKFVVDADQKVKEKLRPKNYPNLKTDVKRMGELSRMFSNTNVFQYDRKLAAEHYQQLDPALEELKRMISTYDYVLRQQTDTGVLVKRACTGFLSSQKKFSDRAEEERKSLPGQIRGDLANAQKFADQAVNEQKPLFFTGGVPQQLGFAEDRLELLKALDPETGEVLAKQVEVSKQRMGEQQESLSTLIIEQNSLPPNRFTGEDREKAINVAKDAWTHQEKDFDVLAVRIPSEAWERQSKWAYSAGAWHYSDKSWLQVQLIVADKEDAKLAIIRPINIWKNHEKADSMMGTPLYSGTDKLLPNNYMLRSKIK